MDGGIDDQTIALAKEAGATVFVAGSYVFKGEAMSEYKLSENNWTRVAVLLAETAVITGRTLIDLSVWIEVLSGSW